MFNPIDASENIKNSFIDYITTTFTISDPLYARLFREELMKRNTIAKGPYIDASGSFLSGKSLSSLVNEGEISKLFMELENVPETEKELKIERPLYSHQERAFELANKGKNLVVTTGTGSGKTECFLLPILNSLLLEKEKGTLDDSVRALIIYPMNALANDQLKRLRAMLKSFPDITFGLYNSSTEEYQNKAYSEYRKLNKSDPLPNEVISREVMRSNPPHILITNYSMLEYMMLRPKDDAVFVNSRLRFIVLDEAHIYRGATGMETSFLIRRLCARFATTNGIQYILTSATLGGEDADDDIIKFASTLCNAEFTTNGIIRSREIPQPMIEERDFPTKLYRELYEENKPVSEILLSYDLDFAPEKDDGEKLYELLIRSRHFKEFRDFLDYPKSVYRLASETNLDIHDLVHLAAISAKAVKGGISLIKPRYHFFIRALEGAFITLDKEKSEFFLTRKEKSDSDFAVFEAAVCEDCGRLAIVGFEDEIENILLQPKGDREDKTDFYLIRGKDESEFPEYEPEDISDIEQGKKSDEFDYVICSICSKIDLEGVVKPEGICEHGVHSLIRVRKSKMRKSGRHACPACERGNFRRFYLGNDAATAVIGTSLFEQLPQKEISHPKVSSVRTIENQEDSIGMFFARRTPSNKVVKDKTRQFLAFSDSRSEAAYFATYMDKFYQEFLRRRGIWQICNKLSKERSSVSTGEMIEELARLFENERTFAQLDEELESQTIFAKKHALLAVMNELVSSRRATGLVQLGKIAFRYSPQKSKDLKNDWEDAKKKVAELINTPNPERDAEALMNLLILDAVYTGALDEGEKFFKGPELEYLFFTSKRKKLVKIQAEKSKPHLSGWVPKIRTGKTQTYFSNTRMERVKRALKLSDKDACGFLSEMWENVLCLEENKEYSLRIQDFDILFPEGNGGRGVPLYKCNLCGRVTHDNCDGRCVNIKCSGLLEEFDPATSNENNHYAKLYQIKDMKPFYIKEHTAQLSRDRAKEYQDKFVNKKIHALSSSTTFEMGVDVGSLETVYLRNVPPTPANYVQRAGRAGRSLQAAAFAITYAKLSSHDFTFFEYPDRMISGQIHAPIFKLENEKVVRRHINAVALSYFFSKYEDVFNGDDQNIFLNYQGYEKFKNLLNTKPKDLQKLIQKSIRIKDEYGISDWTWTDALIGKEGSLQLAVDDFRETVNHLESEIRKSRRKKDDDRSSSLRKILRQFKGDTQNEEEKGPRRRLIDFLVRNNILPKYGFPIDTVELYTDVTGYTERDRPQMQRDLQLAIAEYAPGSEVIADGNLYVSRYIRKLQSSTEHNWEFGYYAKCSEKTCQTINFVKNRSLEESFCISCGKKIHKRSWIHTIEPRRGFISEKADIKMRKPETAYRTDDHYIGDKLRNIISKLEFKIEEKKLTVESTTNDSLVVLTRTNFRVCRSCGYATSKDNQYRKDHKTPYGQTCKAEDPGREYVLSHDFRTDVAKITFDDSRANNTSYMLSVLFALLEAISKELGIERNDIKGCLHKVRLESGKLVNSLVLYDSAAGGAGHIRRIVTKDGKVLSRVFKRAVESMDKCDCEPSCYKCLRNYYNQKIHDQLSRVEAGNFLRDYLGDITLEADKMTENFDIVTTEKDVISVVGGIPLKGEYGAWKDLEAVIDDNDLYEILIQNDIPLADFMEVDFKLSDNEFSAFLYWENKHLILVDEISDSLKQSVIGRGYSVICMEQDDIKTFEKYF